MVNIALRKHVERFHPKNTTPEAPEVEEDLASYVGKPCPKCDEFFRAKDLEAHVKDCKLSDDESDKTEEAAKPTRVTRKRTLKKSYQFGTHFKEPQLKYKFKCYICPRLFCSYGSVIRHIAYNHFKEHLERLYGPSKTICLLCNNSYADQQSLFGHLTVIHGALSNKIPEKHSLEIQNENEPTSESAAPYTDTAKTCFICSKTFDKSLKLTYHYAWTHFRRDIQKLESRCTPGRLLNFFGTSPSPDGHFYIICHRMYFV